MKRLILTLALLVSPNAFADRILNAGEVYTALYAGERVACGGGAPSIPDHYDFVNQDRVDHDDAWQNYSEFNVRGMCEGTGQAAIIFSSTVQRLIRDAKAECTRTYRRCEQLGEVQGRFIPREQNRGRYGCYLRVTVRGSN